MSRYNKGKLYYSIQAISILPLLIYGLIIIFFSTYTFSNVMNKEVAAGMEDSASLCISLLDTVYPGDYKLVENTVNNQSGLSLYKGDYNITSDYTLLDEIKSNTDMDVTLFYQDTRILTTLTDSNGNRIIGTAAPDIVITQVLKTGEAKFYEKVMVNDIPYFAYYIPLTNSDHTVVGMLFIGKPSATVNAMINTVIYPIIAVGFIALIIAAIFSYRYAKSFTSSLQKLKNFFSKVSTGNLNAELDYSVLERKDELSEIGRAAMYMQRSLRNLVELDTLTELYNRRSCDKKLRASLQKAQTLGDPFTVVIADIDFFKTVNDTHGHEVGDLVLHNIAQILKKHMRSLGYAARWGGEEFLLVYENCDLGQAREHLKKVQQTIRETVHQTEDHELHVTLTFGMACDSTLDIKQIIRKADENLYIGKTSGRNCIIS